MAALPAGHGALIAIVIDDVGATDAYLGGYLRLALPLTFAIMPAAKNAPADAATIAAAGYEEILHIPLPVAPDPTAAGGLNLDATDADVAAYLDNALTRVPHAKGANNHAGGWGTSTPTLMDRLLRGLQARQLYFLDSVTTQQTVGYATARQLGMAPRINNVFLDGAQASSRGQLLQLARLAATHRTAIGIGHANRAWLLHNLEAVAPQLQAKGYRFASLGTVTNGIAGGLDVGVRSSL